MCRAEPRFRRPGSSQSAQLALAKLHHDGKLLLARESKESLTASKYPTSTSSKKVSQKAARSRVKSRDQTRKPPPPSLAATHPAFYSKPAQQAIAIKIENSRVQQKHLPHAHPKLSVRTAGPADQLTAPYWQSYVDPKRLAGYGDPALYDPSPRMLKTDTQTIQPSMVSPGFMISLPCGGLVEMATFYGQQPRDPQAA